jgi:molecular chaperone HtpG
MANTVKRFKMEANFEGLIQLLARNLYSEPIVFVRELIQNAHDSILRRRDFDRDVEGRIDITIDNHVNTITFRDNGIGMDEEDVKNFLSSIGSTGTGAARAELETQGREAAYQLIGQFGIGMLSAFVVADKILVRTRKVGSAIGFEWQNEGSADCELHEIERAEIGTEVVVFVNRQNTFVLDEQQVRDAVVKYCDFLPYGIFLNGIGPENAKTPPWEPRHWVSEAEKLDSYSLFLRRRFRDYPLDIIPIEIDEQYTARGVLYISDRHVPDMNTAGVVDVFVRHMLVIDADNTILPRWAKFIRGVIDSPDLQPTAARDNIQRDKAEAFAFLQRRLGEIIIERLIWLAANDSRKFAQINSWHHYHLKGMAWYHDDFFERVVEYLLFETNRGRMPLGEYLAKNAPRAEAGKRVPIYYFSYYGAAAQFYRLADAQGWVVINAGRQFEEELLKKYARSREHTVYLERLDVSDDDKLYARLEPDEEIRFRQLELDMEGTLHRNGLMNVGVRMRRFLPADLPAVLVVTPETEATEKLRDYLRQPWFLDDLEDATKELLLDEARRPLYLSLNAANEIIQRLADADQRNGRMIQDVMLGVYNSAVLHSHNLLTLENVGAIHSHMVKLVNQILLGQEQYGQLTKVLEQERHQLLALRETQAANEVHRTPHVLLFVMTPFNDEYRPLEQAVRRVFECWPYWFEVRLARDYTYRAGLLANVREHMLRAHGFIAEMTDLNPNVMFELGAAMMPDDGRPVFTLRSTKATKDIPADVKDNLVVTYGGPEETSQAIEESIRKAFERDGRIIHEDILSLIKKRSKRFLSRTAIDSSPVKLDGGQCEALLRYYTTVEDFLETPPDDVSAATKIEKYIVTALQEALRGRE